MAKPLRNALGIGCFPATMPTCKSGFNKILKLKQWLHASAVNPTKLLQQLSWAGKFPPWLAIHNDNWWFRIAIVELPAQPHPFCNRWPATELQVKSPDKSTGRNNSHLNSCQVAWKFHQNLVAQQGANIGPAPANAGQKMWATKRHQSQKKC